MPKWIILISASEGGYVMFLFRPLGQQNWGTSSSLDFYLFPFTRAAWWSSCLVKLGLHSLGVCPLDLLSHLTLKGAWPQVTMVWLAQTAEKSPPLCHHDLSKYFFRLQVATLLKSLAKKAMCSLNPSQRKITSGSRAMGLVFKRLLTLQIQKVRYI